MEEIVQKAKQLLADKFCGACSHCIKINNVAAKTAYFLCGHKFRDIHPKDFGCKFWKLKD